MSEIKGTAKLCPLIHATLDEVGRIRELDCLLSWKVPGRMQLRHTENRQ